MVAKESGLVESDAHEQVSISSSKVPMKLLERSGFKVSYDKSSSNDSTQVDTLTGVDIGSVGIAGSSSVTDDEIEVKGAGAGEFQT